MVNKNSVVSNMDSRICNPATHRKPGETCLSLESLIHMKDVWNKEHPNSQIRSKNNKNTRKNINGRRRTLWQELRSVMSHYYDCETEYCVLKKLPGLNDNQREKYAKRYFRPEKPSEWEKKATTWLDSFNIEDVMNQYEAANKAFEFIGPVPIDFDAPENKDINSLLWGNSDKVPVIGTFGKCIVDELCKLDINNAYNKGTKYIGIIYNLDKHDEPGSHWVCSYIDIPKKAAYYFDSYGLEPPPEISRFLQRCKDQGCTTILYNDIRHQRKDSECGMYCLFTIISLLNGRSFQDISLDIVNDDAMNLFRDIIFATEKPRKKALDETIQKLIK